MMTGEMDAVAGRVGGRRLAAAALFGALVLSGCGSQAVASNAGKSAATPTAAVSATPAGAFAPNTGGNGHTTAPAGGGAAQPSAVPAQAGRAQMQPQSPNGHATVSTSSGATFSVAGSTCRISGGQALFFLGTTGSGEEVDIYLRSGYTGPGTYGPGSDTLINAGHAGTDWASSFDADSGARLVIDAGGRGGHFKYASATRGGVQSVEGSFVCG
jgi:hypothetical protein